MTDHGTSGGTNGDAARLLDAAARARLAVGLTDLFLPRRLRLSEWQRETMATLLTRLIRSIEDELRAGIAERLEGKVRPDIQGAITSAHVEIALPILEASDALREPALIALLLRRVEEHRLYRAAQAHRDRRQGNLLVELVRDEDEAVAAAAMGLLTAQSRRLDRFQEPVIATPELPAELEHRLVWTIAAALRLYLIDRHGVDPGLADEAVSLSAATRLVDYDEGEGLDARCLRLARALNRLRRLDDDFVSRAIIEGGLPLFLAAIALRCELPVDAAWDIFSDPRGQGPALLLRGGAMAREPAVQILLAAHFDDDEAVVRQAELFDGVSIDRARTALRLWQIDPAYRDAIARVAPLAAPMPVGAASSA
ncbi:DUF2336 domain-containing protein [Sphingomonas sp.]|uniref:DUF2336 domain-containing protein n=1 Tax=Sphingomonas sp. TaxID=28214 RepID=UPI002FC94A17